MLLLWYKSHKKSLEDLLFHFHLDLHTKNVGVCGQKWLQTGLSIWGFRILCFGRGCTSFIKRYVQHSFIIPNEYMYLTLGNIAHCWNRWQPPQNRNGDISVRSKNRQHMQASGVDYRWVPSTLHRNPPKTATNLIAPSHHSRSIDILRGLAGFWLNRAFTKSFFKGYYSFEGWHAY